MADLDDRASFNLRRFIPIRPGSLACRVIRQSIRMGVAFLAGMSTVALFAVFGKAAISGFTYELSLTVIALVLNSATLSLVLLNNMCSMCELPTEDTTRAQAAV